MQLPSPLGQSPSLPQAPAPRASTFWPIKPGEIGVTDVQQPWGNADRFGAPHDGIRDATKQLQNLAASSPSIMFFPYGTGSYIISDEIVCHPGCWVLGENAVDLFNGAPPAVALTSMVVQTTAGKGTFVIGGACSNVRIENIALSPLAIPSNVGGTDNKIGIKINGTYPLFVWNLSITRVTFYNYHYAIQCIDPLSGTVSGPHPFDWSVSPVHLTSCLFYFPSIGIYIDTNNADQWLCMSTQFFVPANGNAVQLARAGVLRFYNCAAGGNNSGTNRFFYIQGRGVGSLDTIEIRCCQAEALTQSIVVFDNGNTTLFSLVVIDSTFESGSDVYLGAYVHFQTQRNRLLVNVNIDSVNVKLSMEGDEFGTVATAGAATHLQFLAGQPVFRDAFWYWRPGPISDTNFAQWRVDAGIATVRTPGAVPPAGKFYVQDVCLNTTPASGQPYGKICTATGNPATFNVIANVI